MANEELLPIKVLIPRDDFHVRDQPGGTPRKIFDEVTDITRQELSAQVDRVQDAYESDFRQSRAIPAVAKVQLKQDALAKSHRPDRLLSAETCPIIGVGSFRELFISVTPSGLGALRRRIQTDRSHEATANMSTIASLSPIAIRDRLGVDAEDAIEQIQRRVDEDGFFKVRLFDHQDRRLNKLVFDDFVSYLGSLGAELRSSLRYTPGLTVHQVAAPGAQLRSILRHRGVRRAGVVPRFYPVRHQSLPISDKPARPLPIPNAADQYPVVGLLDSGVAQPCSPLQPWIYARETHVPNSLVNNDHGTFVAGILVFASSLNPAGLGDPGGPCAILDVIAIPNGDAQRGPVGSLSEFALVAILHEVVPKHRDTVRVWNLSLGSEDLCLDSAFSDLAQALDSLQRTYNVQFILAAGNFEEPPARTWPPQTSIGERDRICTPADSVAGLTVGSLAHARTVDSVVDVNDPSPFSRRGPGPSYTIKPEIVHYGGNCDHSYGYRATGIRSLDSLARVAEDIGTSFATPLVTALFANILEALDPTPSLNLVKALLIHAAEYPQLISPDSINYFGFGKPPSFERIVHSTRSSATLIFEDVLVPGYHARLDPFPFPPCLIKNGRSTGHIKMTLVYDPPLDPNFGLEYCRANVNASLGTWQIDPDTRQQKYVRQVPPDPKLSHLLFEEDLVKHGFKWSPVKSYRRHFKQGVDSQRWRLVVELLHRHGEPQIPQPFALVVTVTGDDVDPVYDDMISALRGYATTDLTLKAAVRERIRARAQ